MSHRRSLGRLASLCMVAVLAACTQQVGPTGSLTITITGLEAGIDALVNVSGPNGYSRQLDVTSSVVVENLAIGEYVVDGAAMSFLSTTNVGFEVIDAPPVDVTVTSNASADAAVVYAYRGIDIIDPPNDESNTVPAEAKFVYDLVRLWTVVEGDDLLITFEHRADQTDLSQSVGELFIDADQDDATGEASMVDLYCTQPSLIGAEYTLYFDIAGIDAELVTYPTGDFVAAIERVDTGSTSTFAVPLTHIGGSGRVDIDLVVGNFDEPTDCLARGLVDFAPLPVVR